jgi:nitrate reductase delta subunit
MGVFATVADALCYPEPGRLEALQRRTGELDECEARARLSAFLERIGGLQLGEWEELHTRTLDLSPHFAPYVGHAVWGESYKRGEFMAALNQVLASEGVDAEGELPDHLIPVLRYLDAVGEPIPEVIVHLVPALERMRAELTEADSDSPYLSVLDAASASVRSLSASGDPR